MDIDEKSFSIDEFNHNTDEVMKHIGQAVQPVMLTENGRPSLIIMHISTWKEFQKKLECAQTAAELTEGFNQSGSKDFFGDISGI